MSGCAAIGRRAGTAIWRKRDLGKPRRVDPFRQRPALGCTRGSADGHLRVALPCGCREVAQEVLQTCRL